MSVSVPTGRRQRPVIAYLSWRVNARWELFGIPVLPFGLFIAAGFLAGSWLLRRRARPLEVPDGALADILTWVAVGSLVGTRLVWSVGNWSELDSPLDALAVWRGGMTLYGGMLGGLIAGVVQLRRHRLPVLAMLDLAAPSLALGLVFGRAGDLVIGDHLGKPTGMPWGFRYVGTEPLDRAPPLGAVVHPVALYDMVLAAILCIVLLRFSRRGRAPGSVAALFAVAYALDRIALDFLRTDRTRALGLTGTQLASVAILVVVGGWLIRRRAGHRPGRVVALDS